MYFCLQAQEGCNFSNVCGFGDTEIQRPISVGELGKKQGKRIHQPVCKRLLSGPDTLIMDLLIKKSTKKENKPISQAGNLLG